MSGCDDPECQGPPPKSRTRALIEEYGWAMIGVGGGDGSFGYTIGLTEKGHPELLMIGMSYPTTHALMHDLVERMEKGEVRHGARLDGVLDHGLQLAVVSVPMGKANEDFTIQAAHYYGKPVEVLQVVWPDENNLFPWDDGFDDRFRGRQEVLVPMREAPVMDGPPSMKLH